MSYLPTFALLAARFILATLLCFMLSICIRSWHEAHKVLALSLSAGVSGSTLIIHIALLLLFFIAPYTDDQYMMGISILVDVVCGIPWIAALALQATTASNIYKPESGDPQEWHACSDANDWNSRYEDGYSTEKPKDPEILWCRFDVYGRDRWVVNAGAQRQLNRFIGFSGAALAITGVILILSVWLFCMEREQWKFDMRARRNQEEELRRRG